MKEERKTAERLKLRPRRKTRWHHSSHVGGEHVYEDVDVDEWDSEEWRRIYNETWFGEKGAGKPKRRMVVV